MTPTPTLRVLSLFSGIGGFDLACEWAGMEVVGQVEVDPFCNKVLAKHWPDVKRMEDIHDVKGDEFGPVELICGGFPCQPYSVAGKRRGKADDRALWPEMLRIVSQARPSWIIGENIAGFVSMGLEDCIFDLESQGYEVQPFIIPACAVGAPHRRDRVWIVAKSNAERCGRWKNNKKEADCHVANARGPRLQGRKRIKSYDQGTPAFRSIAECNSAWDEPWPQVAASLCRVAHGLSGKTDRAKRLKALGNAVVPQVAYQIMKAIVSVENNK